MAEESETCKKVPFSRLEWLNEIGSLAWVGKDSLVSKTTNLTSRVTPISNSPKTLQKIATGLTGDPVTPLNLHGCTLTKNSYLPSFLHTRANSSKSALSSNHNPIATIPIVCTGLRKAGYACGWASWAVSQEIREMEWVWK